MNENKILAIVILYNPDIKELIVNINQYISCVDKLIIWQNSLLSAKNIEDLKENIQFSHKLEICGDGQNKGIAYALNYALEYAISHSYNFFMSMDQDSFWQSCDEYINAVMSIEDKTIGIFGPRAVDRAITYTSKDNSDIKLVVPKDIVITSGAIYRCEIFDTIGTFKSELFIDGIDEEICYRAKYYGIKTVQVNKGFLLQQYGDHKKVKLFNKQTVTMNYSPFRYFYIVKNHILLMKCEYVPQNAKKMFLWNYILMTQIKIILFEDNKLKKLKKIYAGLILGLKSRL